MNLVCCHKVIHLLTLALVMDTVSSRDKWIALSIICSGTLVCYISAGMTMVALPTYLSIEQRLSATTIGAVAGLKFLATLFCRPIAGNVSDVLGTKQCVTAGTIFCCLSGVATSFGLSTGGYKQPLVLLSLGRILLGFGQALVGTGTLGWIIGITGKEQMSQLIGWNGMASYGAMAIGAPLGTSLIFHFGYPSIGIFTLLSSGLSTAICLCLPPAPLQLGERKSFIRVLAHITPFGFVFSLGNIGYGVLATFITLYYDSYGWQHAEWGLCAFSVSFVGSRVIFGKAIDSYGGFLVAAICLTIEGIGLIIIWTSVDQRMALMGAAVTGFGVSLIYPALGVEAVADVADSNRSSALGAYSFCQDISMGVIVPVAGVIASSLGYSSIFGLASLCSFLGVICVLKLLYSARTNCKVGRVGQYTAGSNPG